MNARAEKNNLGDYSLAEQEIPYRFPDEPAFLDTHLHSQICVHWSEKDSKYCVVSYCTMSFNVINTLKEYF